MNDLTPLINNFMGFAQEKLGFDEPPELFFKQDAKNAEDFFGKTAHYDPRSKSVTVFVTNRHPKDIMRSLAHELVHHVQNLRGDLSPEKCGDLGPGYAQTNKHMREMERQAFEQGNLCFRDWTDQYKKQLQEVKFLKESKKMTKRITTEGLKKLITKLVKEQRSGLERALKDPKAYVRYFGYDENGRRINAKADAQMAKKGEGYERFDSKGNAASSYARSISFSQDDINKARIGRLSQPRAGGGNFAKAKRDQMRLLKKAGFSSISQLQKKVGAEKTGQYDLQTRKAIIAFQKGLGLTGKKADGVFGPATRAADTVSVQSDRPMAQRTFDRKKSGGGVDFGSFAKKTDPADSFDKQAQSMIKKDRTADLSNFKGAPGFTKDPLASDDENAANYQKLANKQDAKSMGLPDDDDSATASGRKRPTNEEKQDAKTKECAKCKGKGCEHCKGEGTHKKKMEENEQLEEAEMTAKQKKFAALAPPEDEITYADKIAGATKSESKIYTPEQEQELYESRFNDRNDRIFDKLKKLWTK